MSLCGITQEVTVGLLKAAILDHPESIGYLIDGFPRELSQADLFRQEVLINISSAQLSHTLH